MSGTPFSPTIPVTEDNMDVDSDSEAKQAAREFTQAQEWLWIANEAQERHREERKQKEEEEKEAQCLVAIEAEENLEREQQAQLQVSSGYIRVCLVLTLLQRDLEALVMMPELLLAPFTDKGKEVSAGVHLSFDKGTEIRNRWTSPGPMGISPAIGADGIGCTVSGRLRVCARKVVTIVWVKNSCAPLMAFGFRIGNGGIGQEQRGRGCGRRVGWRLRNPSWSRMGVERTDGGRGASSQLLSAYLG